MDRLDAVFVWSVESGLGCIWGQIVCLVTQLLPMILIFHEFVSGMREVSQVQFMNPDIEFLTKEPHMTLVELHISGV
jgi:hypothetical protein